MQGHCAEENVDMLSLLLTFPFLMCLQCRSQRCGPMFDELICQGHVPKDNNYDLRRLAACIKPVITCNSSNSCCTITTFNTQLPSATATMEYVGTHCQAIFTAASTSQYDTSCLCLYGSFQNMQRGGKCTESI
jgi:hypothetical protein